MVKRVVINALFCQFLKIKYLEKYEVYVKNCHNLFNREFEYQQYCLT